MTSRWRILEAAQRETEAAVDWYERHRRGLGLELLDARDRCLELAAERPESDALVDLGNSTRVLRRYRLDRFPYAVVVGMDDASPVILAFMHLRRRPDYWHRRLSLLPR